MAVTGIQLNINSEELRGLAAELQKFFGPNQAGPVIAAAIRKAIEPMKRRLKDITPVGPTGNLKRAVSSKVVSYRNTGIAVGLVGYRRANKAAATSAAGGTVQSGPDRANHQWWLERGTKDRTLKQSPKQRNYMRRSPTAPFVRTRKRGGKIITETVRGTGVLHEVNELIPTYIASSFNRLGPFQVLPAKAAPGQAKRVQTDPAYPNAFFRKSNKPIQIPAMPEGGSSGMPPVQTAFMQTQGEVAGILQRELSLSLAQAWAALRFRESGTVTGTDTLGPA